MENPPPVISSQSSTIQPQKSPQEFPVIKPTEEKPKNKLVPLLVFLLLAALGVASYFGWQNYQLRLKQEVVDVQPEPSSVVEIDETANWKTYQGSFFSFKYPDRLFTISEDEEFLTFYQSTEEAKETQTCKENKLGTTDKPCGEYMVLNIGVSKYPLDYQYSLKLSLDSTDPGLLKPVKFVDKLSRDWIIEGPIEIAGGSNLKAEYEDENSLFHFSVQIGSMGFEKFFGEKLTNEEHRKLADQILSTFKFVDGEDDKLVVDKDTFSLKIPKTWKENFILPNFPNESCFNTERPSAPQTSHDITPGLADLCIRITTEEINLDYLPKESNKVTIDGVIGEQRSGYTGVGASVFTIVTIVEKANEGKYIFTFSTQDEVLKQTFINEHNQILSSFQFLN